MKKKPKPFYYLEFGSPDLMFGSFSETYTTRKAAVEAFDGYVSKYANPWGRVFRVTDIVASVETQVKYPKKK